MTQVTQQFVGGIDWAERKRDQNREHYELALNGANHTLINGVPWAMLKTRLQELHTLRLRAVAE